MPTYQLTENVRYPYPAHAVASAIGKEDLTCSLFNPNPMANTIKIQCSNLDAPDPTVDADWSNIQDEGVNVSAPSSSNGHFRIKACRFFRYTAAGGAHATASAWVNLDVGTI